MDSDGRRDVDELVARARQLPPPERDRFLDTACQGASELRRAVERELALPGLEPTRTQPSTRPDSSVRPAAGAADTAAQPHDHREPDADLPTSGAFPGYHIVRELRHGGQGVVYQAIQQATKRKVAIKVLLHGKFASAAARRRFEREIETVAQLQHPDIISIFHADVTSDGRPYYVMDYVRGEPLSRYVREHRLSLRQTLELFARICHAVHYAHQRGVLHRDLKPSNILIDADGNPKVLDFGLAKWLAAPVDAGVTTTQAAVGTLPYMAPEQTRNDPDKIDVRTDVYALGVLLYVLLTGYYPYPVTGDLAEVLNHIVHTPPVPPEKSWSSAGGVGSRTGTASGRQRCPIDREVRTIVLTALAKQRERRYQTAAELAGDIERYLGQQPIHARGDSVAYLVSTRARTLVRRHPVLTYLVVIWAAAFITDAIVVRAVYSWTPLNDAYERRLSGLFGGHNAVPLERVRVVALTDVTDVERLARAAEVEGVTRAENRSLRRLHGRLMEELADGAPLAVAYDISFEGETDFDEGFARGARTLRDQGVEVIVGTTGWLADERGLPRLSRNILPHVRWGSMVVGASGPGRWGLDVCLQRAGHDAAPSLALATLAAARRPDAAAYWTLQPDAHAVDVRYVRPAEVAPRAGHWVAEQDRVKLTEVSREEGDYPQFGIRRGDQLGLLATPIPDTRVLDGATIPYHEVFRADDAQLREWFAGKVVVVGDLRGTTDRHQHPDGRQIAGCYIHATGIDMLLGDRAVRVPGAWATPLLLLGGALLGVLAMLAAGNSAARRIGFLIVLAIAACAACVVAYQQGGFLCNPLAPLSALVLAALFGLLVRRESHARV